MAISIDWDTLVINIPQADLTPLGPSLFELDIENTFRAQVNAIMASEEGIPFLDPISHNTEVVLSGVTYARIVEVINGYTVTFEDGQYGVNTVGANHNIADVLNRNQVSLVTQNSAGLISVNTLDIEDLIEPGISMRQALRGILSSALAELSGAPAGPIVIRDANDTKDRITATVDADGNRLTVVLDLD